MDEVIPQANLLGQIKVLLKRQGFDYEPEMGFWFLRNGFYPYTLSFELSFIEQHRVAILAAVNELDQFPLAIEDLSHARQLIDLVKQLNGLFGYCYSYY